MITRFFNWATDTDFGKGGWLPAWLDAENFQPSGGIGVAHDFFEHSLRDTGRFRDEIRAFGAMTYIRGEGGYFPRPRYEQMARLGEELGYLYVRYARGESDPFIWPSRRKVPGVPAHVRRLLKRVAANVELGIADEWGNEWEMAYDRLDPPEWTEQIEQDVYCWLAHGYLGAKRRFHDANRWYSLGTCFEELERKVDRCQHAEEGDRLRVRFDYGTGEVEAVVFKPWGEDYLLR